MEDKYEWKIGDEYDVCRCRLIVVYRCRVVRLTRTLVVTEHVHGGYESRWNRGSGYGRGAGIYNDRCLVPVGGLHS